MATLTALPALLAKPPEDTTIGMQRLLAIKSLLGQQKMQDIQTQEAQLSLQDRQAQTKAMQQWDGKDPGDIPQLILKNGGSGEAFINASTKLNDMRQKAATLDETTLKNQQTRNDQYRGRLLSIVNAPDDQKQSLWDSEITKEEQAGTLKPGQVSHTYPGDDQATYHANSFALGSTLAKEATEKMSAQGSLMRGQAAQGELDLRSKEMQAKLDPNSPTYSPSAAYLAKQAQAGDKNAQAILAQEVAQAGKKAGAEAAAKFPYESKLEAMRQQGDSVYAFDPKSGQTIQTSRGDAQSKGLTNIVKVGETQIGADKARAMQLGDAQMNISAYRVASQKMDELSGSEIAKVGQLLGDSGFKAHFLGAELPSDWMNSLMKNNLWTKLPPDAQEAVVGYLATRPAAISMLRAINPGVRLNESQIKVEMQNIPDPTTPSNVREQQFDRIQRNLDQAATTIPVIPGVDRPSDIRARIEGGLTKQAIAQRQAQTQAAQNASGQFTDAKKEHPQGSVFLHDGKWMRVSKVYPDKSFDAEETTSYAP